MSIDIHLLNATGALSNKTSDITSAFRAATRKAKKLLQLEDADVVVNANPHYAIPELGVGGYTDSINNVIYLSINLDVMVTAQAIEACLDHEYYHLVRHQRFGVPMTLKDRTIDEGLACLYELETSGETPIYAEQEIARKNLNLFRRHAEDKAYTDRWFFGEGNIPRWFAYSLGFRLVSQYKNEFNKTAVQMLGINNSDLYGRITQKPDVSDPANYLGA